MKKKRKNWTRLIFTEKFYIMLFVLGFIAVGMDCIFAFYLLDEVRLLILGIIFILTGISERHEHRRGSSSLFGALMPWITGTAFSWILSCYYPNYCKNQFLIVIFFVMEAILFIGGEIAVKVYIIKYKKRTKEIV